MAPVLLRAARRRSDEPGPPVQAGPAASSSARTAAAASRTRAAARTATGTTSGSIPTNPKHVIGGDDGGLWISYDGGNRWWKSEQPADLAVLSRERRRQGPVPGLRRPAGQQLVGRRLGVSGRHHERALGEPVRRRRLLDVRRSDRPERGLLPSRRAATSARVDRKTHGVARHPAEGRLQGEAALQLEHADPREPDAEGHDLHRRAVPVPLARSRRHAGSASRRT